MASTEKVQNTHIKAQMRRLHGALMDIVAFINRPQVDEVLIGQAGISLDRALFPLLIRIERSGPIGIVDLADRAGRDYTTVSRQVTKLESLGLVTRQAGAADRRVRAVAIAPKGRAMTDAVDAARDRMGAAIFSTWEPGEFDELVRLTRKFADALPGEAAVTPPPSPAYPAA